MSDQDSTVKTPEQVDKEAKEKEAILNEAIKVIRPQSTELDDWLNSETNRTLKGNIEILATLNEYKIINVKTGQTETFERKIMPPKDIAEFAKLDNKVMASANDQTGTDPQIQYECQREQAKLCLKNMSDAKYDELDGVMLQNIILANRVISKGFCPVQPSA